MQGMKIYAQTHTGLVQQNNEDRHVIKEFRDGSMLLAVADGLGGDVSGDLAADMIKQKLYRISGIEVGNEAAHLRRITQELDTIIADRAKKHADLKGMGSTLVCILIRGEQLYWVHVGDSRLYLLHDNRLHQITNDQTLARFLVGEGELSLKDIPIHYSREVLDQCIGCGYSEPETGQLALREKDVLLISSDGLHKHIGNQTIEEILGKEISIKEKAQQLINASLKAGGGDDITVIVTEIG
jgi:protein phosphatase